MRNLVQRTIAAVAVVLTFIAVPAMATAPTITSFTPTKAALGKTVTISGTGFIGATSVKFGGATSTFSIVSGGATIHATVPTLAHTGKITVTAPSGTATSTATFTVAPGILPTPATGSPTTAITVSGSGFGASELVDIYEGATDVALAVTSTVGTLVDIPLTIPASAPPGALWISAAGRHSGLAAQTPFTVRTNWANPRRTALGSGFNAYENVLNTSTIHRLEMDWTTTDGTFFSDPSPGVVVASGLVIAPVPLFGTLVALHADDGSQAWSQPFSSNADSPGPAVGSGIVVAPSADGKLHAYSQSTGAVKWTTPGPSDTGNGAAVISGSTVYAPGATALQAFNLTNGTFEWQVTGPCTGNVSTPAVSAGIVIFTCTDSSGNGELVIASTAGTLNHAYSPGSGTLSAPAISGGNTYELLAGNLWALSQSGYNLKWSVVPPFSVYTAPAVADGYVATCGGGGIWVVNAGDGTTAFENAAYPCIAAAPVTIANGVIYEPQGGSVAMFDEFGNLLGRLGSGGTAGPVSISDGAVYAGDSGTGVDRWAIPAPGSALRPNGSPPDVSKLHPDRTLKPYPGRVCVGMAAGSRHVCVTRKALN
jgi:outer membrane protein assembly factor BamB